MALATCAAPSGAQTPRLIKDLNTAAAPSDPWLGAALDGRVYFSAFEPDHGRELWRSDGTAGGTGLVIDLVPGPLSSEPRAVVATSRAVFFQAGTDEVGRELWVTDGTAAGTRLLTDLSPGPAGTDFGEFAVIGDRLYFFVRTHRFELWATDGTQGATRRIWHSPELGEFAAPPQELTVVGERLYFIFDDGVTGYELWISDGKPGSTRVLEVQPGRDGPGPSRLVAAGDLLFFSAYDTGHGEELWRSDGTVAGTVRISDIVPGSGSSWPSSLIALAEAVLFIAHDPALGWELYRSDGQEAGTGLLADVYPGPLRGTLGMVGRAGGRVFFTAVPEQPGGGEVDVGLLDRELWATDGTVDGTTSVHPVDPPGYRDAFGIEVGDVLFFPIFDEAIGQELWRTDGTEAGTGPVSDIAPGPTGSQPNGFVSLGDRILFSADERGHGRELWTSDGTDAGTRLVRDINAKGTLSGVSSTLAELDGILYFGANDAEHGSELWRSDGTPSGTFMVRDIHPNGTGFSEVSPIPVGEHLFFLGDDGVHGLEPWISDGTAEGTRMIVDLAPGPASVVLLGRPLVSGDLIFLVTYEDERFILWRSDGTRRGTWPLLRRRLVLLPGAAAGGVAYFADRRGLVRSDGTAEGTFRVAELDLFGSFKGSPGTYYSFGDLLLFTPGDAEPENELWRSDGTVAGTHVVADIAPGPSSSYPHSVIDVDGVAYFVARDASGAAELWRTDGTTAGTRKVIDLRAAADPVWAVRPIGGAHGTLYFSAPVPPSDDPYLPGLWKTRGTPESTKLVSASIQPIAQPSGSATLGRHFYFVAQDSSLSRGRELWRTDGTKRGTELVADLYVGPRDSSPGALTVAGSKLFFTARSSRYGTELWVLGAGTDSGAGGRVSSLPNADGLGSDEVAVLGPTLEVRDAASGVAVFAGPAVPDGGWETVDIESMADLDGNGSSELAILARRRQRLRLFVRDGLTGEMLSVVRLRRRRAAIDLEVIPGAEGAPPRLAVLSRRGLAGRARIGLRDLAGGEPSELTLPGRLDAIDLAVAAGREGATGLVVLGTSGDAGRGRLLVVEPRTGRVQVDRWLDGGLVPLDLEVARTGGAGRSVVVLAEQVGGGPGRVISFDPATGEELRRTKLGDAYRSLDLELEPARDGAAGPLLTVLQERRKDGAFRLAGLDAGDGRRRETAELPGMLLAFDLTMVRDVDGSGVPEAVVLAEDECAGGGPALVIRDAARGALVGCHPLR